MITWKNKKFYINDEPFEIHGGSIHYFRSMPEKWYDLLLKLKNCGLNTVETYCPWNLHEPQPGEYDFSGRLDLERFIETAQELGLYVILRPGPYICAEWDQGGLPGWLLKDKNMRLRTSEGDYLKYVRKYFDKLMPHIIPHLETNGGNVILVAAENEFGSFGDSTDYMNICADMLREYGVDVPIITADGHTKMFLDGGHADGCICGIDFGYDQGDLNKEHTKWVEEIQPDAPILHIEHWIGMFSRWGEPTQSYPKEHVAEEVRKHLEQGVNFVLYMFHGGTNFGFTNGANVFNRDPERALFFTYYPDVTSYDYDALLNEWGEITPKYLAVQQVMSEYLGRELPVAEPLPIMEIGEVELAEGAELFDNLTEIGEEHHSQYTHHMEYYGQNEGYILYRTTIKHKNAINLLAINDLADMAYVYFNGEYKGSVHRNSENKYLHAEWMIEGGVLDIIVENQGRVNFGAAVHLGDRKGLLENVVMYGVNGPGQNIFDWEVYTLPMKDLSQLKFKEIEKEEADRPMFYRGTFKAEEKKNCFIHFDNLGKGFIVVNGFNLGRYWEIGPQKSLYVPAEILKDENEIIVFDIHPAKKKSVSIKDYHILNAMASDENPETIM